MKAYKCNTRETWQPNLALQRLQLHKQVSIVQFFIMVLPLFLFHIAYIKISFILITDAELQHNSNLGSSLYNTFICLIREGVKKICEKAVRLTALGGEGGHPPPAWPKLFVKIFVQFFPLWNGKISQNMSTYFEKITTPWPLRGRGRGGQPKRSAWPLFHSFF